MKRIRYSIVCLILGLCMSAVPVSATGYYGKRLKGDAKFVYRSLEKKGKKGLQKMAKKRRYLKLKRGVSYGAIGRGMRAFAYDHPEVYWANGFQYYGRIGRYNQIRLSYYYYKSIPSDFKAIDKELNKAIRYVRKQNTRYKKVKAAHDYISKRVSYAWGVSGYRKYSIAGILKKNGRKMVCAGYAKMFQAICLANHIPCLYVTGLAGTNGSYGDHAWNYVRMGDKKWYLVDCTWDDGDSNGIDYDYFLAGSGDIDWAGYTMTASHQPDRYILQWRGVTLRQKLPKLAERGYGK